MISHRCLSFILLTEIEGQRQFPSMRESTGRINNGRRGKFETTSSGTVDNCHRSGSWVPSKCLDRRESCLHLFLTFVSLALMLFVFLRAHISRARPQLRPKNNNRRLLALPPRNSRAARCDRQHSSRHWWRHVRLSAVQRSDRRNASTRTVMSARRARDSDTSLRVIPAITQIIEYSTAIWRNNNQLNDIFEAL